LLELCRTEQKSQYVNFFEKMTISEILKIEETNTAQIYLIKEGFFWRAYERSAYRFVKYIRNFQVIKKHIKKVNQEVCYIGFPENMLEVIISTVQNPQGLPPPLSSSFVTRMFPLPPVPAKLCLVGKTPPQQNPQGLTTLKSQQNLEGLTKSYNPLSSSFVTRMFPLSPVPAKLYLVGKTPPQQNPQGLTKQKPQQNPQGLTTLKSQQNLEGLTTLKSQQNLEGLTKLKPQQNLEGLTKLKPQQNLEGLCVLEKTKMQVSIQIKNVEANEEFEKWKESE
jgi:hypothetical protein